MKVLVVGANGLIGTAVCARLVEEGHTIVGAGRGSPVNLPLFNDWISVDFTRASRRDWLAHLPGADAVVNCVGVLQDNPRADTKAAHFRGPVELFAACETAGVRRVVHFSAIGVERHQASAFSTTKLAGDEALMKLSLGWVILRPSVVLGSSAFGASALFRGLAALPWLPVMPDSGPLQVVDIDDVTATVSFFLKPDAPSRVIVDLAGPAPLPMAEVIAAHRRWLGWRPARMTTLPRWASRLIYRLGDLVSLLGWRPPVRSTAMREIAYGAVGDPGPWTAMTGITPVPLDRSLARRPAGVQERWFARLYFLKPVLFTVLASFWLLTGVISLTVGFPLGVDLMVQARTGMLAAPGVIAGAIADLVVGLAIAWRPTTFVGLWAAIALASFYIIAGTVLLPELWTEPLGPLLKIWPILAAHAIALAILKER